ncbi:receptor-type tyrosine-protein phosphatase H [Discoglossus pictus]
MTLLNISPGQQKSLFLLQLMLLIWHGGTGVVAKLDPVSKFDVIEVTETSVELSWVPPNSTDAPNYSYNITVLNSNKNFTKSTEKNANHFNVTGLEPGSMYTFEIITVSLDNISISESVNATTRPSTVTNLDVTGVSDKSVTLKWDAPTDINAKTYSYNITIINGSPVESRLTKDTFYEITNLEPGMNYTVSIYTLTANKVYSSGAKSKETTTRPSTVSILDVTVTDKSVSLKWDAPTDINAKTYSYNITITNGSTVDSFITKDTSYEISNLEPGMNYTVSIYTLTANNVYSSGAKSKETTTKPSTVSILDVTGVSDKSVTLKWDAPTDINAKTYSYNITITNGSPVESRITKDTFYEIKNLEPGMNYTVSIYTLTANNVYSSGAKSKETTTRPSTVSILDVTVTDKSVSLKWDAPTDINAKTYSYNITITNVSSAVESRLTKDTFYEITNLEPGIIYTVSIYTLTANNVYSSDAISKETTTKPSQVTGFKVSNQSSTSMTLSWIPPNDRNADSYTYNITVSNGTTTNNVITDKHANTYTVPLLEPGVTYTFNIYTVTSNGVISLMSESTQATTNPSPVNNIVLVTRTTDSIAISWTVPKDINVARYTYFIQIINGSRNTTDSTSTSSYTANHLSPGNKYTFQVQCEINGSFSTISSNVFYSIPSQPYNISTSTRNTTALYIYWDPPHDDTSSSYQYQVIWKNERDGTQTKTISGTNTLIDNLKPGNLYDVTVSSVISDAYSAVTQAWLQTDPLAPQTLSIGNITNATVTFSWIPPSSSEGIVSGFDFQAILSNGSTLQENISSSSSSTYTMAGLIPGMDYNFTLRSFTINSITPVGRISRREVGGSSRITYSDPITRTAQMDPNTVTALSCKKVNGGYALTVNFGCPGGFHTSFNILVSGRDKVSNVECKKDVTVPGLQPASPYKISVETLTNNKNTTSIAIQCNTDNTGVIVGSIFGVLLFLLLLGVIAFFVLKMRRSKGSSSTSSIPIKKFPTPIPKENFPSYYNRQHADSDFGFAEEYQQLSSVGTNQAKTAADIPDNRPKNRFTNVLPYDHTRVKLCCIDGDSTSDYINANYMPGFNSSKEFVASQGPLPNTTADFWRMVWEHHVNTIVMLTNCMENGRVKCEHYWPLDYTPCTYEDITVTVTSETILPDWTIRDFTLKHAKQLDIKYVRHFHFTVWPDHGVPENTTTIIKFRNLVRDHMDQRKSNGPTVVHCSAGVGRTGTLIALDYLMQQMEKEHRIGVYNFVQKMRMNRTLMVQTESQYVFLNKCMLDLIEQPPEENIYENQMTDLIYENASAVREFQRQNV